MMSIETYKELKNEFNRMHDELGLDFDKYEREDYFFYAASLIDKGMSLQKALKETFEEYMM